MKDIEQEAKIHELDKQLTVTINEIQHNKKDIEELKQEQKDIRQEQKDIIKEQKDDTEIKNQKKLSIIAIVISALLAVGSLAVSIIGILIK